MLRKSLSMAKIEKVLRLTYEKDCSHREVGRTCGVSQPAERNLMRRARTMGLGCWLPEGLGGAGSQDQLYDKPAKRRGNR